MNNSTNVGNRNRNLSIRETLRFHMDMYESLSEQLNTIATCMATTRRNIDLYSDMYYQNGGEYSTQMNRMNNNRFSRNSNRTTNNQTPNNTNPRTDQSIIREIMRTFLTPVAVRPTQEQISSSTRTCVYSEIQNPINTSCSICQSDFQDIDNVIQIRSCGHIFHREELLSWFERGGLGNGSVFCPMCRVDIRETTPYPLPLPTSVTDTTSSEEREEPEPVLTDADRVTQSLSSFLSGDPRIEYDSSNNQFLILESEVIFRNPNRTNDN